jgi:hypothetical protein
MPHRNRATIATSHGSRMNCSAIGILHRPQSQSRRIRYIPTIAAITRRSNANCAQAPIRRQRASEIASEMDPPVCQMSHSIRKGRLDYWSESRHRRNSRLRMVLCQMPYLQPTTLEQARSPRNRQTTAVTADHRLFSTSELPPSVVGNSLCSLQRVEEARL